MMGTTHRKTLLPLAPPLTLTLTLLCPYCVSLPVLTQAQTEQDKVQSSDTPQPTTPPAPVTTSPPGNPIPVLSIQADKGGNVQPRGEIEAYGNIEVRFSNAVIRADKLQGNINRELIFSGNARIETQGAKADADAIHVYAGSKAFRLDNPRGILSEEFLRNRLTQPLFISGASVYGTTSGFFDVENCLATTCKFHNHHYDLRFASAELYPNDKIILRRVAVRGFGVKLITLPTLVIPLGFRIDRPRPIRTDYLPEIGQNAIEGYYARFPYAFTLGAAAAAFVRLDVTERRGQGYRLEHTYLAGKQDTPFNTSSYGQQQTGGFTGAITGTIANAYGYGNTGRFYGLGTGLGPQNGGLIAIQGYLRDGFARDFNASLRHQQSIGSNNRIAVATEISRNSAFLGGDTTNQTARFNFSHNDPVHGVNAEASLNYSSNHANSFSRNNIIGNYRHSFEFGINNTNRNSLSYSFDLNRSVSSSNFGTISSERRSALLESNVQFQHVSRDYSFSLSANKSIPIGTQSDGGIFGTLERLPELQFSADSFTFKRGWFRRFPLRFDVGVGRYSEPIQNVTEDRVAFGITMRELQLVSGKTEITSGGGFEQRLYSGGGAQYILRNQSRLRQHIGGRSGFDIRYDYAQPQGGTPFNFDPFNRIHGISAEGGYLDDPRFQMTARIGYDLLGTARTRPFQSLSTRTMWRPTPSVRFDLLSTYDPNTGRFFAFTQRTAIRTNKEFALDLVTRIDPNQPGIRRKFSQINAQLETPIGADWRVTALLRYSGATGKFESTNFQIAHRWDCMEATLTYTENPNSFRRDRQIYFTIRLTALPFFRSFARGAAGESLGVGFGDFF